MTVVDWSRFRQCPVCFAVLGAPCLSETVAVATAGATRYDPVVRDRPHSRRKLRTGAVT